MNSNSSPQNQAFIDTLYHTNETCNIPEQFFLTPPESIQPSGCHPTPVHGVGRSSPRHPKPPRHLGTPTTPRQESLRFFHSQGFIRIPAQEAGRALFVPKRPYDDALATALAFCEVLALRRAGIPPALAWIHSDRSFFIPHPPTLASLGFALEHCVFIETPTPLRTLRSICEEHFFDVILFDDQATPAAIQMARRWLKPAGQPLLLKAEESARQSSDKLMIFID